MRGVVFLLVALLPLAAAQSTDVLPEPSEYPACDVPEPVRFAQVDAMLENLEFDGNGSLFLTAFEAGLYRVDVNGTVRHVAASDRAPGPTDVPPVSIPNAFMGVTHHEGALYVSEGHAIGPPTDARILRFPDTNSSAFEVHATGFPNANGMAGDDQGNLYLAHGFRDELWKVTPDGSWDVWTRVPDAVNGVVEHPDGKHLVIAPLGDGAQAVYKIPFDAPDERHLLFRFVAGASATSQEPPDPERPVFAKGIDDLGMTKDGRVLISGHFRNQFLMGDPATGEACILLDGARAEPSSIRVAHGFGAYDGWAFTTDFSGDVWAIDVRLPGTGDEPAPGPTDDESGGEEAGTPALGTGLLLLLLIGLAARSGGRDLAGGRH